MSDGQDGSLLDGNSVGLVPDEKGLALSRGPVSHQLDGGWSPRQYSGTGPGFIFRGRRGVSCKGRVGFPGCEYQSLPGPLLPLSLSTQIPMF